MLVGRHLQPDDIRRRSAHIDDHSLDHRDDAVSRERVLPRFERGVADLRPHEVHLADATLILLEGRDLLRVR